MNGPDPVMQRSSAGARSDRTDHTTLSRRARTLAGRQPRASRHDGPMHLVLDSTGLQVFG